MENQLLFIKYSAASRLRQSFLAVLIALLHVRHPFGVVSRINNNTLLISIEIVSFAMSRDTLSQGI